jgi:hypothetical protein
MYESFGRRSMTIGSHPLLFRCIDFGASTVTDFWMVIEVGGDLGTDGYCEVVIGELRHAPNRAAKTWTRN